MNVLSMRTKIISGKGAVNTLSQINNKRVSIVCDEFMVKSKKIEMILNVLPNTNQVKVFDKVVPNPTIEVVQKALVFFYKDIPDILIAFGGGSAIDTAKAILYFAKGNKMDKKIKLIAIPTTSGTGSEVTSATVITDTEQNVKHAIFDDDILPNEAILDPTFTLSVPKEITANTGMDVLTHALESYVAKNANNYSDAFAEKSVELLTDSLLKCYMVGDDEEARAKMQESSNLAGTAFNIAGLGINHAIAHQLGSTFHIPHGLACAIVLPHIIKFNCGDEKTKKKYAKLAIKSGMVSKCDDDFAVQVLIEYIKKMMDWMEMNSSLRDYGISRENFCTNLKTMVQNVLLDSCIKTTPREVIDSEVEKLLIYSY